MALNIALNQMYKQGLLQSQNFLLEITRSLKCKIPYDPKTIILGGDYSGAYSTFCLEITIKLKKRMYFRRFIHFSVAFYNILFNDNILFKEKCCRQCS